MYQALYRKWRPRTFDDVVGQRHITETLKRQVQTGRLSHAYLFTGTRGTGKTTCAKILARAVNCQQPKNGNPCNQCPACLGIENGSVLDVLELDAASNNRVDDIRAILDEAVYTPATVHKRVYIVDEVHMLSLQAFNALLQILEEPPAHLMFILATTEIHKVPATIKSRCQQFAFKRIHPEEIAARLRYVAEQEQITLTSEGALLLARLANGGMRDALSLLDQCAGEGGVLDEGRIQEVLGLAGNLETAALLELVAQGDCAQALQRLNHLYENGKEMEALAGELSSLVRDLLVRKTAPAAADGLLSGGYDGESLRKLGARFDQIRLVHLLRTLQETGAALKRSSNQRTDLELCLMAMCDPSLDPSPAALAVRVARLEQERQAPIPTDWSRAAEGEAQPENREEPPAAPAPQPAKPLAADLPRQKEPEPPAEGPPAPAVGEQSPAEPESAASAVWPGWETLRDALAGSMDIADYVFLKNEAMVTGRWDGGQVVLWASSDFLKERMIRPAVTQAVSQMAQRLMGCPVRVSVRVGQPPADVAQRGGNPAQEEPDALEAFLQDSQGNVTQD